MTEVITYRLSATGIWQYDYWKDGEKIGSAAFIVSPWEPARITGPEVDWYSRFDIDSELVPGVSRKVKDNRTGDEVYRIVYWRPGLYEVRTRERSIQVEIRDGNYLFGTPGMPVAALTERTQGEPKQIRGMDADRYFRTVFFDPATNGYMMMVLSFPALRFC